MTREDIPQDPFDINFRRKVASEIRKAKHNIQVITGEISAYDYLDMRRAAEEAAERGVKIEVYAKIPDEATIERLLAYGIDVYLGQEDPLEHCMIRDGKAVTISYKQKGRQIPTPMGERIAVWSNEPEEVREYKSRFQRLKGSATKQVSTGKDPLEELFA